MFTVKEFNPEPERGSSALLQFQSVTSDPWGTMNSDSSMGPPFVGASAFASSNGIAITSFTFTPKSAQSKLLIEGPPIPVSESQNVADDFRIAIFRSNGALVGESGGSFSHEGLNPQPGVPCLRVWADSWGTSGDTLTVRVASSGSHGNHYLYNNIYQPSWQRGVLTFTITEVEA